MSLRAIYGHEALRNRLAGVIAASRLPQSVLFVGPRGVGKQRLALWVGQALLCSGSGDRPCGACGSCRQVLHLSNPDLHWFTPVPRPKSSDPSKQVDEVRESLGAVMEDRRRDGTWGPPEGMVSHPLASVRALQQVVALTPFSGSRKVVVLGDAEWLIVQEASQEAANALLKALEEPPADTTIILTATEPQQLLPTIRSRVSVLRVGPVGDDTVREFLRREVDPAPTGAELERRVLFAEGAIGRAVGETASDGSSERANEFISAVERGPQSWLPLVLSQPPWSARGEFSTFLDGLAVAYRQRVEQAEPGTAHRAVTALRKVEGARTAARGNVNPQLTLSVLASDLAALR